MDYKRRRVRLRRGGSYIKSSQCVLYKRATINPENDEDDECFQHELTLALNYNEIKKKNIENIF